MRLTHKLILVGLVVLVLPWAGWQSLRETEQFLRAGEERALLATAGVLARAAGQQYQRRPWQPGLYVRSPAAPPLLDGYVEQDWEPWESAQALGPARLALAERAGELYLAVEVKDASVRYGRAPGLGGDHLLLALAGDFGERRYLVASEAPGWVQAQPLGGTAGPPLRGEWQETGAGYSLELRIPKADEIHGLGLAVVDLSTDGTRTLHGTGPAEAPARPRPLLRRLGPEALAELAPAAGRVWLVDPDGWVLSQGGDLAPEAGVPQGRWVRSLLYRYLLASPLDAPQLRASGALRLQGEELVRAWAGESAARWRPASSESTVIAAVAAPVEVDGRVVGAVVVEQASDSLLLLTNRALTRLLSTTGLAFAVALALLFVFATRLSLRIRRLRDAAERAVAPEGGSARLPLAEDADELGDLSRAFGRTLHELREYADYLRTLADKLSHELRTPLAVVSSSLDNLGQEPLPAVAVPYLERARQGAGRLSRILRAMSEASRLEQSLRGEEGEAFDLAALVCGCVKAYQDMAPQRRIECRLEPGEYGFFGSPELIGQLLDKLVDNALGFAPPQGRIAVALSRRGQALFLRVENEGPPLPERMRGRLFDSMVSVREGGDGEPHLGLGLYIVRLIAELHGGEVRAADLPQGGGVEFVVGLRGMISPPPAPQGSG